MRLNDEKWLQMNVDKWWNSNPNNQHCSKVDESQSGIIIGDIGGIFVLICVGIIAAFVTLIYEFFYFNYFREQFEAFYDRNLEKLKSIITSRMKVTRISVNP